MSLAARLLGCQEKFHSKVLSGETDKAGRTVFTTAEFIRKPAATRDSDRDASSQGKNQVAMSSAIW